MSQKIIDFTVGADPEMVITDETGNILKADNFVRNRNTDFGSDGNGTTFEVRPGPSKNPLVVVNNIREIFIRQTIEDPRFLNYRWISGSFHEEYPIGGHIHFGIKKNQIRRTTAVGFLDNYLSSVSLLMEDKLTGIQRREESYGFMGDFREQRWGFEYRPLSSWLSSPYLANAIMCLSKTIMYEVMNNPKFDWHTFVIEADFLNVDQKRLLPLFPKIWNDIVKMKLYQVYKPYIDFIYLLITNGLTWLSVAGVKEEWAIMDMKQCLSRKVGIDTIWNRYNHEQVISQ